jgi:hypothetical protein
MRGQWGVSVLSTTHLFDVIFQALSNNGSDLDKLLAELRRDLIDNNNPVNMELHTECSQC